MQKNRQSIETLSENSLGSKLPVFMSAALLLVCILPFILTLMGFDFSTQPDAKAYILPLQAQDGQVIDAYFRLLSGAFSHTLLEWSAFCVAVFVVILAFSNYRITGDLVPPIIGVVFFMAACMDAFHILAANRLINAVADNQDLIPFTWAICRFFNVFLMILGIGILFIFKKLKKEEFSFIVIVITSLCLGFFAYIAIHLSATSANLPQTIFPDAILTRPYDAIPLIFYIFAGLVIYPQLYRQYPSLFSHALIFSAIAQVATQLHMVFGSTALYDHHFNVAHFMKIFAYVIPLMGLMLDYVRAHQSLQLEIKIRKKSEKLLQDAESRQRSVVENMVDGLMTLDAQGVIVSFNPAASRIFGFSVDEVAGKNYAELLSGKYREKHQSFLADKGKASNQATDPKRKKNFKSGFDIEGCRKDGTVFPMELAIGEMVFNEDTFYTAIIRDISERKQMEKLKNEFISTVSHELRTPLTSIRGSLGLINGGAVGELPQQAKVMLNIASNNTQRLLLLINDILDIQKMESGQLAFNFQTLDLMSFLEQSLSENAAYGEQFGVKFVISAIASDARAYADRDRLMQVMSNLLSNAAKFSPENDTVEVSISRFRESVRISVTDHGCGIPEGFRDKLFDKFTQSDSSDSRQKGGTGLGLNISKIIVEKHGGRIDFVSGEGLGSTFYFELPELKENLLTHEHRDELLKPVIEHLPCVLIVEDDPDIGLLIQRMLAENGYNSDIAHSCHQAMKCLQKNGTQYKLITLDLSLPLESGMSFLNKLRNQDENHQIPRDIPVVVVSVKADEAKRDINGGAVGVIDWLPKPIDQQRLINAVRLAVTGSRPSRVLHVEDDSDIQQLVAQTLLNQCQLISVPTLSSAVAALTSQSFDLVLLDVGLPDGSGVDLLAVIEQCKAPPQVIIFSANDVNSFYADKVSKVLLKSQTDNLQLTKVVNQFIK